MASQFVSRSTSRLVEAAAHRAEAEARRDGSRPEAGKPVVTISREFGARGGAIGRLVAERLGFECWDQELVHEVSLHLSAPETSLEALDERRQNMVVEFVAALFPKASEVSNPTYQAQLQRLMTGLARRGGAVIVGRGGQYLVRPERALRVRIVAPLAFRVAGVARRDGLTTEVAERRVRKKDAERAAFMRENFGRTIEAVHDYDLILNAGAFGIESAAELIASAYRARFPKS